MVRKTKRVTSTARYTSRWYRVDAWLDSNPEMVVRGHRVRQVGDVKDIPVIAVPPDTTPREMAGISDGFRQVTGRQPLIFNAPVALLRLTQVTSEEAAALEPTTHVFPEHDDDVDCCAACKRPLAKAVTA